MKNKIMILATIVLLLVSPAASLVTRILTEESIDVDLKIEGTVDDRIEFDETIQSTRADPGLVGQWHMDEGNGNNVEDSSGNGNHGTLNGASWVNGVKEKALDFDGVDDYVDIGMADFQPQEYTFSLWFNATSIPVLSDNSYILSKDTSGNYHDIKIHLYDGTASLLIDDGDNLAYELRVNINVSTWYYFVGTYNGGDLKLYLDGELKDSITQPGLSIVSSGNKYILGAQKNNPEDFFEGIIDEVSIYNRALTYSEIRAQYSNIKLREQDSFGGSWFDDFEDDTGIEGGLGEERLEADEHTVGLWHFDEGSGNEANDASGNGNDGTLQNLEEEDWVDGRYGGGLEFDGVNEYVSITPINIPSSGTIEGWYKFNYITWPTDDDFLFDWRKAGSGQIRITTWPTNNQLRVDLIDGSGKTIFWDNADTALLDNNFHYIVVRWDGSEMTLFVDNINRGKVLAGSPSGDVENGLTIGSRFQGHYNFNGAIDEVRISNIARTPDEIKRNYEGGLALRDGKVELVKNEFDPEVGCVGYWNFDEGTGNTLHDISGNGNDGMLNNMDNDDWVEGKKGKALDFDGSNDYVEIQDNDLLDLSDNWTIEVWLYIKSFPINANPSNNPSMIISKWGTTSTASYMLAVNNDRQYGFGIHTQGGATGNTILNLNEWYHIAVTLDSEAILKIYLNGVVDGTNPNSFTPKKRSWELCFGREPRYSRYFNGIIDEIAFYNRPLSPEEISQHYHGKSYTSNATLASTRITLPENKLWSTLALTKTEPAGTYINVSILKAEDNSTIPNFDNLTGHDIDLTPLNDLGITSIRLKAYFSGNGGSTPYLDSWGVEWTAENAWRDSFTGDSKVAYPYGVDEHTLGYWRFEEGSGNVARDLSGNGNDGTLENMDEDDWVDGARGKALEFDGVDDYVEVPRTAQMDAFGEADFSMSLWLKTDGPGTPTSGNRIISKRSGTGNGIQNEILVSSSTGHLFINPADAENDNSVAEGSYNIFDNKYHHIVYLREGNIFRLYLDGSLHIEDNKPEIGSLASIGTLKIGRDDFDGGRDYFNGIIDEVRISNIARTPEEIRRVYQAGIAIRGGQAQLAYKTGEVPKNMIISEDFEDGDSNGWFYTPDMGAAGILNVHSDYAKTGNFGMQRSQPSGGNTHHLSFSDQTSGFFYFECDYKHIQGRSYVWIGNQASPNGGIFFSENQQLIVYGGSNLQPFNNGQWYHIKFEINVSADTYHIYIDDVDWGIHNAYGPNTAYKSISLHNPNGFNSAEWIDNVEVYTIAENELELLGNENENINIGTLQSKNITLPQDKAWSTLHFSRSVPENTYLNVSVHDASTNEILLENTSNYDELYLDMMHIDPVAYPYIYLMASLASNGTVTPILYDWAVNWTSRLDVILPDLTLNTSDISFSNPNPMIGETIQINATVSNVGYTGVTNLNDIKLVNYRNLTGHTNRIISLDFSPNGKYLASGSSDKSVKIWDTSNWSCIKTLIGYPHQVMSVAWSPNGSYLATETSSSYGANDGIVKIWDTSKWTEIKTITVDGYHTVAAYVDFSPDGDFLGVSSDHEALIYNTSSWNLVQTLPGISSLAHTIAEFSPDGNFFTHGTYRTLYIVDPTDWANVKTISTAGYVESVDFNSDGSIFAFFDQGSPSGYYIKIYDTLNWNNIKTLDYSNNRPHDVKFSSDAKYLTVTFADKSIKVWNTSTWDEVQNIYGISNIVHSIDFSPDGKYLAGGLYNNFIQLWDLLPKIATATVSFYDGNPIYEGVLIGQGNITLWGNATAQASVIWTATSGTHDIYVRIEDVNPSDGNLSNNMAYKNITVAPTPPDTQLPVADAGSDLTVNQGISVIFNGSASTDNVGIVNYTWAFVYDSVTTYLYGISPQFTFNIAGNYVVVLIVSDSARNYGVDFMNVIVFDTEPPVANAGINQVVNQGTTVTFNGSASISIANYTWSFRYDGVTKYLYGVNTQFLFNIPGNYTVTLNVSNAAGSWDMDTMSVLVNNASPLEVTVALKPIDVNDNKGTYMIVFSVLDANDPNIIITAIIQLPIPSNLSCWDVELKVHQKLKIEIDADKMKIKIKGPDPEYILAQLREYGGIVVENGQVIDVKLKDEEKYKYEDKKNVLKIDGPEVMVIVTAIDTSGNIGMATASLSFKEKNMKDEEINALDEITTTEREGLGYTIKVIIILLFILLVFVILTFVNKKSNSKDTEIEGKMEEKDEWDEFKFRMVEFGNKVDENNGEEFPNEGPEKVNIEWNEFSERDEGEDEVDWEEGAGVGVVEV